MMRWKKSKRQAAGDDLSGSHRPKGDRLARCSFPNSIAIIKGSPNPAAARQLVDYCSARKSRQSSRPGGSHQIPLNPSVTASLPPQMETPRTFKTMR